MSISSNTHFCKGLEKGDWFHVIGYSCQSESLVVEYVIKEYALPGLMYKSKSDFQPIPTKGNDSNE